LSPCCVATTTSISASLQADELGELIAIGAKPR
jgi:hypothetical protein